MRLTWVHRIFLTALCAHLLLFVDSILHINYIAVIIVIDDVYQNIA